FARPDQEIIDEIRDHIMGEVLWIDPGRVDVRSNEGNVVLSGRLETRSDADLLDKFTARVDGVVSVASHLDFEVDDLKLNMTGLPTRMITPRTW
ncbi:MAG TPA: BON domain-containing protein, partial [Acidimicrobiia bacterium]|nr:BON domain-containing protein [Acidimicrobiia bacterium]